MDGSGAEARTPGPGSMAMTTLEVVTARTVSDMRSKATPAETAAVTALLSCNPAARTAG